MVAAWLLYFLFDNGPPPLMCMTDKFLPSDAVCASAVYAVVLYMCLSVRLCLSQIGVPSERVNVG